MPDVTSTSNPIAESLADALASMRPLLERFLVGFDASNATAQAMDMPNHVLWVLGHLALYNHEAAARLADTDRDIDWDVEPFAFHSTPDADPHGYPPLAEMIDRWRRSCDALERAVRSLPDESLADEVAWGAGTHPKSHLIARMIFHNGTHCGQLIDLRRALGLRKILS